MRTFSASACAASASAAAVCADASWRRISDNSAVEASRAAAASRRTEASSSLAASASLVLCRIGALADALLGRHMAAVLPLLQSTYSTKCLSDQCTQAIMMYGRDRAC